MTTGLNTRKNGEMNTMNSKAKFVTQKVNFSSWWRHASCWCCCFFTVLGESSQWGASRSERSQSSLPRTGKSLEQILSRQRAASDHSTRCRTNVSHVTSFNTRISHSNVHNFASFPIWIAYWHLNFLSNINCISHATWNVRRYPRIEFFHTDPIHAMMVDILFIFAKLNVDISYRQVCAKFSATSASAPDVVLLNILFVILWFSVLNFYFY